MWLALPGRSRCRRDTVVEQGFRRKVERIVAVASTAEGPGLCDGVHAHEQEEEGSEGPECEDPGQPLRHSVQKNWNEGLAALQENRHPRDDVDSDARESEVLVDLLDAGKKDGEGETQYGTAFARTDRPLSAVAFGGVHALLAAVQLKRPIAASGREACEAARSARG